MVPSHRPSMSAGCQLARVDDDKTQSATKARIAIAVFPMSLPKVSYQRTNAVGDDVTGPVRRHTSGESLRRSELFIGVEDRLWELDPAASGGDVARERLRCAHFDSWARAAPCRA